MKLLYFIQSSFLRDPKYDSVKPRYITHTFAKDKRTPKPIPMTDKFYDPKYDVVDTHQATPALALQSKPETSLIYPSLDKFYDPEYKLTRKAFLFTKFSVYFSTFSVHGVFLNETEPRPELWPTIHEDNVFTYSTFRFTNRSYAHIIDVLSIIHRYRYRHSRHP